MFNSNESKWGVFSRKYLGTSCQHILKCTYKCSQKCNNLIILFSRYHTGEIMYNYYDLEIHGGEVNGGEIGQISKIFTEYVNLRYQRGNQNL